MLHVSVVQGTMLYQFSSQNTRPLRIKALRSFDTSGRDHPVMPCHIPENAVWLLVHDCQTIPKIVKHESAIKMARNSGVHFMKRDVTVCWQRTSQWNTLQSAKTYLQTLHYKQKHCWSLHKIKYVKRMIWKGDCPVIGGLLLAQNTCCNFLTI
jgi:hypothetical protein